MKNILWLAAVAIMAASCKQKETTPETTAPANENEVVLTDAQYKNAGIETVKFAEKNISTILKVNGKIDVPPQNMVSVSAPMGGYVRKLNLLPGEPVHKGQVIAVLEDQQYVKLQQDYLVTKSKLQVAEQEYTRQRTLNESKAASDKITEQAGAEATGLRVTLKALEEQLKLISINPARLTAGSISRSVNLLSPINGFVTSVLVNTGKYANPSDVLLELIDPSDIHLNLNIFEKDAAHIKMGQNVIAYTNSNPSEKHMANIVVISKDVNASGIVEVHCHFKKYDAKLLPGTYMNAEIETTTSLSSSLPEDSIVTFEGKDYVFVKTGTRQFTIQPVTAGKTENGFTEIKDAASLSGKEIVGKGAYTLLMKMKNTSEEEEY